MNVEDDNELEYEPGDSHGEVTGNPGSSGRSLQDEVVDLIPAYSIGAVDPEESELVQAHLTTNPAATEDLAAYAALYQAMLHSSEERAPGSHVADQLRLALREGDSAAPQRRAANWRDRFRLRVAEPMWVRTAVAVALALLAVLNMAAVLRIRSLQDENRSLTLQLSGQRAALAMMTADGVETATLPAAAEGSGASATVRWAHDGTVAVVNAQGFPALEPGLAYQLWLIRDGQRTSGGLFTVNSDGAGTLVVTAPDPVGTFDAMGITPEPAAGSPGPTSPPVVVGPLGTG